MSEKIAIYDVRGIQDYIFRTNKVKEIIGGSKIVENLIIEGFENACKSLIDNKECSESDVITKWKDQEYKFDTNPNIKIEVLYYGGGNLVVLFRTEELCKEVSILMSKNIMKNAYGLSLVYAYTDKTENYNEDWKKLKERLSEIKAVTPPNKPAGILPIVQYDRVSGKPLSKVYKVDNRKVTYEAYQKLKKYDEEIPKENTPYMKEFDKMRTSKEEGLIAIVHIDGNNMGKSIGDIMKEVNSYSEAVKKTRKISKDIHEVFEIKAINRVKEKIVEICKNHGIKVEDNELPFRPLIQAGDDITFVCNERIALDIVKEYINTIREGYMYNEEYKFSACAGIAIIHAHYPFYEGYQIAEECCKSAKERAKNEGMVNGKIGNFVDFEYCYSGNRTNLELSRKENYTSIEGNSLLKRPYGIYKPDEQLKEGQKPFDLKTFEEDLKFFEEISMSTDEEDLRKISRTTAKAFRDAYYETESTIKYNLLRHQEKNKNNIKYKEPFVLINNEKHAEYYDALEMLDIWGIEDKGVK